MAKDKNTGKSPAFLFYPGDWLGGTMTFTRLQKGGYIDLLMCQFNQGRLTEAEVRLILGSDFDEIWPKKVQKKFKQDKDGLWYNVRLEAEQEKRKGFVTSRNNNKEGKNQHSKNGHTGGHTGGHMTDHMTGHTDGHTTGHMGGHTTGHMENENENEDRRKDYFSTCSTQEDANENQKPKVILEPPKPEETPKPENGLDHTPTSFQEGSNQPVSYPEKLWARLFDKPPTLTPVMTAMLKKDSPKKK